MKIVLLENVKKLGKKDEIVEVSDGYARNVIIPKKQGVPATAENLNSLKLKNKNEEKKDENFRKEANRKKEELEKKQFILKIKAGESGKTFGSITSKEICDEVLEKTGIDIEKKDVELDDSIKHVGSYDIKARLYKDIFVNLKIKVECE